MDMSKSQIDTMSQSMTETEISEQSKSNDLNNDEQFQDQPPQQQEKSEKIIHSELDYEQSVTEKENMLMSSFNKMSLNGNGLNNNLLETNNNLNLINGQHGKDAPSDLIINDGNTTTTNGHDKNSIENTL